jgi:hypothetical protein
MVIRDLGVPEVWVLGVDCGEQRHRFVLEDKDKVRHGSWWVSNRMDKVRDALMKVLIKLPEGYRLEMVTEGLRSIGGILPLARNESEGKAATYAGLTPLSRRSGKKGGPSKLARGINKHAVRALYLSAVSAKSRSALDRAYYEKQLERHQGHPKPHVKSFLSLARQRFKVMYKLLRTEASYDKEKLIESHLKRQKQEKASKTQRRAA